MLLRLVELGQLTAQQLNAFTPITYAYDAAGRRTSSAQGTTSTDYTYDPAGRLDTRAYTTRWWIFTSTWKEDYTYDGAGQLQDLTVTEPNHSTHPYDLSWDIARAVPRVIGIQDDNGTDDFVWGTGLIGAVNEDDTAATFSIDAFGSALRTDATADWVRSTNYTPDGEQQNSAWSDPLAHSPAFGYCSELMLDNTIHLRNRTFIPKEGAFTTTDPLDGSPGTATYTNAYHYADNNPINKVDPLGLSVTDEAFDAMIGGWTPRMSTSECLDLANALRGSLVGSGVNSFSDFDFCKQFLLGDEAYDIYDRYQGMCETGGYQAACYAASFLDHGYPASRADEIIDYYCNGPGDNWSWEGCDEGVVYRDHLTEFFIIDLPIAVSTSAFTKLIKIPVAGSATTETGPGAFVQASESMSARAAAYQAEMTGAAPGTVYRVGGVDFDGFANGVLLEAKGPGYASFVRSGEFQPWFQGADSLVSQASRQLEVAGGMPIQWFVAEPEAAAAIRNLFVDNGITGISVVG